MAGGDLGLYLHLPFCRHRCGYCDFVTWADRDLQQDPYLDALTHELARRARPEPVSTVFLGGGTPSLLGGERLAALLGVVRDHFTLRDDAEVTVECNPEGVTPELVAALRGAGVGRVSLGVQTFDPAELVTLERVHDAEGAARAMRTLEAGGVPLRSLDLIYGLPGQSLESWRASLARALELDPGHLSLYALTLEAGAPWTRQRTLGDWQPDGDLQADMYEAALEDCRARGYEVYEISNLARPGHESRHNLRYWRGEEVLGFGVGAWGGRAGVRERNSASLEEYLADQRAGRGPFPVEALDPAAAARERLVLGLRLEEGADLERLFEPPDRAEPEAVLERFRGLGLTRRRGAVWSLTDRGRMLANTVMAELI